MTQPAASTERRDLFRRLVAQLDGASLPDQAYEAGFYVARPDGVAESLAPSADRQGGPEATERPEPPGPTRSAQRENGEDGDDATLPQTRAAVPEGGAGRLEADQSAASIEVAMSH